MAREIGRFSANPELSLQLSDLQRRVSDLERAARVSGRVASDRFTLFDRDDTTREVSVDVSRVHARTRSMVVMPSGIVDLGRPFGVMAEDFLLGRESHTLTGARVPLGHGELTGVGSALIDAYERERPGVLRLIAAASNTVVWSSVSHYPVGGSVHSAAFMAPAPTGGSGTMTVTWGCYDAAEFYGQLLRISANRLTGSRTAQFLSRDNNVTIASSLTADIPSTTRWLTGFIRVNDSGDWWEGKLVDDSGGELLSARLSGTLSAFSRLTHSVKVNVSYAAASEPVDVDFAVSRIGSSTAPLARPGLELIREWM